MTVRRGCARWRVKGSTWRCGASRPSVRPSCVGTRLTPWPADRFSSRAPTDRRTRNVPINRCAPDGWCRGSRAPARAETAPTRPADGNQWPAVTSYRPRCWIRVPAVRRGRGARTSRASRSGRLPCTASELRLAATTARPTALHASHAVVSDVRPTSRCVRPSCSAPEAVCGAPHLDFVPIESDVYLRIYSCIHLNLTLFKFFFVVFC